MGEILKPLNYGYCSMLEILFGRLMEHVGHGDGMNPEVWVVYD